MSTVQEETGPFQEASCINYLEVKAVFLALKEFQDLCSDNIALVATDNTTVVSYINKEGGMRSGPLCDLLRRILTWCTRKQVTLRVRHIPDRLNVVADKLSRVDQTIQTELFLLPELFQMICSRWHRPQIDLFAKRFNNKLPAKPVDTALHTDHGNLTNLNLYAWLLEPQQSRSRASLRQWQRELRLLKEDQPD